MNSLTPLTSFRDPDLGHGTPKLWMGYCAIVQHRHNLPPEYQLEGKIIAENEGEVSTAGRVHSRYHCGTSS